jgi:hypothetical protein
MLNVEEIIPIRALYAPSRGQKIEGPLGVKYYGLRPGFLKYNSAGASNIIIHIAGSPIEFK